MKKAGLFFISCLAVISVSATTIELRHHPVSRWKNNQVLFSESNGFALWVNDYGAPGGGAAVEFGYSYPLLVWNQQFFLMADGTFRLSAVKKTSAGIGGTMAGEFRFYNRRENLASYGFEVSWGLNAMVYSNEHDNVLFHYLYGSNWMRAGYLKTSGSRFDNTEYFAQFQYYQKSWYVMCGISLEQFERKSRKRVVTGYF